MAKHGAVLTSAQVRCKCPRRRPLWRLAWLIPTLGAACAAAAYSLIGSRPDPPEEGGPLTVPECIPPSIDEFPWDGFSTAERQSGWILVHILLTGYICAALATVCDNYFVPSLESICDRFKVPSDVAGATFMAIGTSSPELFSAIIGSFVTEGDIGIGTIVGSAVFNILGVTSLTGLLLWNMSVPIDWFPISRDSLVYITSVGVLVFIIRDNVVTRYEAASLFALFFLYLLMMYFNKKIEKFSKRKIKQIRNWWHQSAHQSSCPYCLEKIRRSSRKNNNNNNNNINNNNILVLDKATEKTAMLIYENNNAAVRSTLKDKGLKNGHIFFQAQLVEGGSLSYDCTDQALESAAKSKFLLMDEEGEKNAMSILNNNNIVSETGITAKHPKNGLILFQTHAEESSSTSDQEDESENEDEEEEEEPTQTFTEKLLGALMWPANTLFRWTIPDCRQEESAALYPYTFTMAVLWIGVFSYLCSWMVTIIGHTFGLPDSVAGITILAAGISVPEIVANIIVVKNGMANMALSNLIGSNIFDILFCLGLPWLIKTGVATAGSLAIHSGALTYTTLALMSTVGLLFFTVWISGWRLNARVGGICLLFYIAFLVVACMFELNMFGQLNPPTCT